jgi:putative oxidoreductase
MNKIFEIFFLIGRFFVGAFYLYNGLNHFINIQDMSLYLASHGVPAAVLMVMLSGILLFGAGITFLLGIVPHLGVLFLLLFFLPVNFIVHNFWAIEDPQARMQEMDAFMKNTALLGSSLMFLMIPRPWRWSLESRR